MKVILLDDVAKVGRRGEVREVSDGYARNFLIPRKLALGATAGNLKNLDHIKRQQEAKADRIRTDAESVRARVEALLYEERRQASEEGKLFGSVTSQDIADFLARHGITVERRRILLDEPIKALGELAVPVRLHAEVTAQLRVNVLRDESSGGGMAAELPSRIPPHNLDAERAVLGAILLEGRETLPRVIEMLRPSDFYTEAHRATYDTMLRLFDRGAPVDLITLNEELRRTDQLEFVGGPAALALLVEQASIAAHLGAYATIVRDMAMLRELIQTATQVITEAFEAKDDVQSVVESAEQRIFALGERRLEGSAQPVGRILKNTFEYIEHLYERKEHVTGLATGFEKLDLETSGFQPSDFIIIAGRPSMGKTAFALNIAQYCGVALRRKVLILSLEMSAQQLVQRMLCSEAKVDSQAVRTGYLTSSDWHRLTAAAGRLSEASIFIDDSAGLTVLEARAKARRMKAEHGLDMVVIDYLQLMRGRNSENRQQEISEISRSLKALAKELNVPVVALSQLSRAVEARAQRDFRPQLSDLRESGALEQDADLILFLYRQKVYKEDVPPEEEKIAEVIIGKQRNGPIGTVKLVFLPEYARFENAADLHRQPQPF
jgi:replicative DNA helicase